MAISTFEDLERQTPEEIQSTIVSVKKMLMIGAVFAVVGYLLVGLSLFLELTQFHPLLEQFFTQQTEHSLAGGGPDRAGDGSLNGLLASIHTFPSLLMWLKLGGVAHILLGIFVALVAIVRVLSLVPARLSYEMERTQEIAADSPADD